MIEEIGQSGVSDPIPVIDANLSFTRRVDPSCLEDCEYEKIGDFDWLREVTGVDIGFSNNSTDIQRLIDNRIHVENSPTAYVVKNSFDLLRATREDRYGVLLRSGIVERGLDCLSGDSLRSGMRLPPPVNRFSTSVSW